MESYAFASNPSTILPASAFAPVVLSEEEAHALLSGSQRKIIQRKYFPSEQLVPITGHTGEHELLPVDSAALRAGTERRLTFMIRKLPRELTAEQVRQYMLSIPDIQGTFDLLYVPVYNGKQGNNRGYCFLNFTGTLGAARFAEHLALRSVPDPLQSCEVVFAHVQGKANMLRRLNESVSHNKALPGLPFEFPPPGF